MIRLAALLLLIPSAALTQEFGVVTDNQPSIVFTPEIRPRFDDTPRETVQDTAVTSAAGAVLRGLDKVSGDVTDLAISVGESARLGRLVVQLDDCRYPVDNPSGDAFAHLTVRVEGMAEPAFDGWMIASSPALSALDHPRYDVWVMRCSTS